MKTDIFLKKNGKKFSITVKNSDLQAESAQWADSVKTKKTTVKMATQKIVLVTLDFSHCFAFFGEHKL